MKNNKLLFILLGGIVIGVTILLTMKKKIGEVLTTTITPIAPLPLLPLKILAELKQDPTPVLKKIVSNFGKIIKQKASKYGVPEEIITSVIWKESGGNPNVGRIENVDWQKSRRCEGDTCVKGSTDKYISYGLMQIIAEFHWPKKPKELFKPDLNVEIGTKLLADLYKKYQSWPLAVMAYNAGVGSVNGITKIVGSTDWQEIIKNVDKYKNKYPLFVKFTVPYVSQLFGEGGVVEKAKKVIQGG